MDRKNLVWRLSQLAVLVGFALSMGCSPETRQLAHDDDPLWGGGRAIPQSRGPKRVPADEVAQPMLAPTPAATNAPNSPAGLTLWQQQAQRVPTPQLTPAPSMGGDVQFSYEHLQQMLQARNVSKQVLQRTGVGDEWRFICAIPDPRNPTWSVNYEAEATGANGLAAIRLAIAKIDSERK